MDTMKLGQQKIELPASLVTDYFAFGDDEGDRLVLIGMTPGREPLFAILMDDDAVTELERQFALWRSRKGGPLAQSNAQEPSQE